MISENPTWPDGSLIRFSPGYSWCRVCGYDLNAIWRVGAATDRGVDTRCHKHRDRNPCVIEGCSRTRKATHGLSIDDVFCAEHWRAFVPPGSPERRIYNRFFRRAKLRAAKYGEEHRWPPAESAAFFRVWRRLVSRARARGSGDLDVREINRVMGW